MALVSAAVLWFLLASDGGRFHTGAAGLAAGAGATAAALYVLAAVRKSRGTPSNLTEVSQVLGVVMALGFLLSVLAAVWLPAGVAAVLRVALLVPIPGLVIAHSLGSGDPQPTRA